MDASGPTMPSTKTTPGTGRLMVGYVVMLLAAVLLFFLIRWYGEQLSPRVATPSTPAVAGASETSDALLHVLLALVAIILLGRWESCFYTSASRASLAKW